jgi:arylsulfatase A-like enzyme
MTKLLAVCAALISICFLIATPIVAADRPNVLMICVDDLNDWVEPLGGHPQVKTPAMASLAAKGMTFLNAHCQSPLCNSSRASVMTSLRPSTTGIYGLAPWHRSVPGQETKVTLGQYFENAGYETYAGGKVFHSQQGKNPPAGIKSDFMHWGPDGGPGITPPKKLIPPTPAGNNPWVDWGVFEHDESKKGDAIVATWAEETIRNLPSKKPFFMAVGFFMPHVPCHVTPKYWGMYPEETLVMPNIIANDRADCSPFSWYLHWNLPEPRTSWLEHHQQHKNLVRSYLGCITFADAQIKRVLDALEASGKADNTIICLWSDHGWHLGEKQITGKNSLWERSTHVPLIFAGPGVSRGVCKEPAELLDVYPTLAELAGLPSPEGIEGISLKPQIGDPNTPRNRPAITDHNPGNFGIRDRKHRLIHYADGSEELYDIEKDPDEHTNRIDDPAYAEVAINLRKFIRKDPAPLAPGSAQRILERRDDGWYWENQKIDPDKPPMSIGATRIEDLPRVEIPTK